MAATPTLVEERQVHRSRALQDGRALVRQLRQREVSGHREFAQAQKRGAEREALTHLQRANTNKLVAETIEAVLNAIDGQPDALRVFASRFSIPL